MTAAPSSDDTTLAILAGGEGARMGGPKAQIHIEGAPILQFLLRRLDWPGPTLLVTAPGRENPPGCRLFDREVTDPVGGQGPLRGLHTALAACETALLIATTVDMPFIEAAHLGWLCAQAARAPEAEALMLNRRSAGAGEGFEPFPSLWRTRGVFLLEAALASGARSLRSLVDGRRILALDAPPNWSESTWTNLNRLEDLDRIGATLGVA